MMKLQDKFNKLADVFGSNYAAIRYLANSARQLMLKDTTQLLDSQALTWAITGEKPVTKHINITLLDKYNINKLEDVLCYVDDEDVCQDVRTSYEESLKSKHLIYCCNRTTNEYQQARVRVLVRIIWYNLEYMEGNNR